MSSAENAVSVTFKEYPIGTHREENVAPLEVDQRKAKSETAVPDASSENKPNIKPAGHDMGTPPPCHPDKRSSAASKLSATLHNEPQIKQEVPTFAENEKLTDQFSRGFPMGLPKQDISEFERMFTDPVTSFAMECLSETKKFPVKSLHNLPVAGKSDHYDQLHNICNALPPVTAPPLVWKDITSINGYFDSELQKKLEEPAVDDKGSLVDLFSKEKQINLSVQDISEPTGRLSTPVISPPADPSSKINETPVPNDVTDRLNYGLIPLLTPQHQPVADNIVQHVQLHNDCDELPAVTAPPLVQHEVAMLDGTSDSEPHVQPEPVDYDSTSEEAVSGLEAMVNSPASPPDAEVLSEVDESPDVDEKNLPDGSNKRWSYPQCPLQQAVAINYARHEQLQNHGLGLPSVTPPSVQHNVMGCSSSAFHFPSLELLATPKDEYYQNSNLFNPRMPQSQRTSVPASSSAFARPPGWYASVRTSNAYQPPAQWASCIPTGAHTAADRMLLSENGYNNNGSTLPLTGHKRPREGAHDPADQVPSNGFPNIYCLTDANYRRLTAHSIQQVLGAESQTPSVTPFRFSGSPLSFSNTEMNGISQYNLHSPATQTPSWNSLGHSSTRPTQNQTNVHQATHNGRLPPSIVGTMAPRVSVPVPNALYNPSYERLGLPIDPILRAFHDYYLGSNNKSLG